MLAPFAKLGVTLPVLAAPMAGGPTTPDLVIAAWKAGGMGFLAAGYRSAANLSDQMRAVQEHTQTFGVNLFAPNPVPVDPAAYARYRDRVRQDAALFGATVPDDPLEDDDGWRDKIDLLVANPVPIVSFTFGIPDRAALGALRAAGSTLVQTVTWPDEAVQAADAGVDALVVQGSGAGGHIGTYTPATIPRQRPLVELVADVRARVSLPILAGGGVSDAATVADVMRSGADAVVVGTALLRSPEAGTSGPHRAALGGQDRGPTVVTRAFSGRPARAVRNTFVDAHQQHAPSGYPAIHHLTSAMRRAAAAAGSSEYINLWAGTGYRACVEQSAGSILWDLAGRL